MDRRSLLTGAAALGAGLAMPALAQDAPAELAWEDLPLIDALGLELGYRLIPLADATQGGELMGRIRGIRRKLSEEMGFLFPAVHVRDNLELKPSAYRITLRGVVVGNEVLDAMPVHLMTWDGTTWKERGVTLAPPSGMRPMLVNANSRYAPITTSDDSSGAIAGPPNRL